MKTYIKPLIFVCVLILIACESNNQSTNFKGKWVENVERKDTLLFENSDSIGFFILSNGFEFRNGYWLPRAGSGLYSYKFKEDSILVNPAVSDAIIFTHYYFHLNSTFDVLQVGNFYNSSLPASTKMTFVRIN